MTTLVTNTITKLFKEIDVTEFTTTEFTKIVAFYTLHPDYTVLQLEN